MVTSNFRPRPAFGFNAVGACLVLALNSLSVVHAQEDIGAIRDRMVRLETSMEIMQKEIQFETLKRQQIALQADAEKTSAGSLPYIVSVGRVDDRWFARLQFDTGVVQSYRVGDLVLARTRVSEINENGVTVARSSPASEKQNAKTGTKPKSGDSAQVELIALKLLPLQSTQTGSSNGSQSMSPGLNSPLPPPIPGRGR